MLRYDNRRHKSRVRESVIYNHHQQENYVVLSRMFRVVVRLGVRVRIGRYPGMIEWWWWGEGEGEPRSPFRIETGSKERNDLVSDLGCAGWNRAGALRGRSMLS